MALSIQRSRTIAFYRHLRFETIQAWRGGIEHANLKQARRH